MSGSDIRSCNKRFRDCYIDSIRDPAVRMDSIGAIIPPTRPNPLDIQEGGNHYKSLGIQPVEYIHANSLGYFEGNVVKYITRWRDKNGLEDLKKVKHYVDLLIELEGLNEQEINFDSKI